MFTEADRLDALRRHGILDTPADPSFQRIVEAVREVCRVPIALVSLVDAERQWFKAAAGTDLQETPRDTAVCGLTIQQTTVFQIEDLSGDPRTAAMSLVSGPAHLRFYAGVPLITSDGHALGSLCAIDVEPRPEGLTPDQHTVLKVLADQVVAQIEMQSAVSARDEALALDQRLLRARDMEVRYDAIVDSAIDSGIISFDADARVTSWSRGAERLFGWSADEMLGELADKLFTPEDREAGVPPREFAMAREAGRAADERWHQRKDGSRFYAHGALTPLKGTAAGGFVKAVRDITPEHETRNDLLASREKLELATRAARLGQFDYFPQTDRLEWDDRCRELFGLKPGAPVSYEGTFLAGLHPDDRDRSAAAVTRALDPAGSREFEVEYRTVGIEDGLERHVLAQGMSLVEDGIAVRLIGTVQDVTADRRAQAVIRETEERLRLATRATNDAIWDWNLVRDHVQWNEAVEKAYGHPLSEVPPTGAWWIGHIHPDDRARIDQSIHAVIDGGATDWTDEYRFLRGDGSYADVRDRGYVLRDEADRPIRMIGAMLDVSELKANERRLKSEATSLAEKVEQSEVEVERLWSTSPDLLLIIDAAGVFREVNPAWTAMLGYEEGELVGHHVNEFVLAEDHPITVDAYQLAAGGGHPQMVNRYRHKDGSTRWIAWVAAKSGEMTYATGRDITAEVEAREVLRQTEEALRQSQKVEAVGQLTGGVAHDFNNLLTVIRGSVDLLQRPNLPEERRAKYIQAIADTADRATKLTGQLLAFARRSALQPQVFDAKESIASVQGMLQTLTGSRIKTGYELPDGSCWVNSDPSQFDTAIVNMAVNARDAMNGEGDLTIAVRVVDRLPAIRSHPPVRGRYVAVSITDTGSGIPADKLDHIFEPFFTTKGVGHGTGLGLSQVYGFAKQSNGEVTVNSRLGRGSTFTLYLPEAAPAEVTSDEEVVRRPLRAGSCILVVEDNSEVGEFATAAMSELGYRTHWEPNADAALAELERSAASYDVVFSDVVMPGMSGVELAERIRTAYPDLPVVLTSGYSHVLAEQGSQGFPLLHKPYSIEELAQVLERVTASEGEGDDAKA